MNSTQLAAQANINSIRHAMGKNREAWLALFRDDAVLKDPVGPSPLNPEGNGHIGKEAIAAFFDTVIALNNITLTAGVRCTSGDYHCAVPMQAVNDLGGGLVTTIDMVAVYEVDQQGLIKTMSAYWSWAAMEQQLANL